MKIYISITLTCLALLSCKDTLEETVYSSLTDDSAFTSGGNAQAAVNAMYTPLHSLYREPMFFLNDVTVDTGFKGGSPFEMMNEQGIFNDNRTLDAWNYLYQIATRANVALDRIPAMDARSFAKVSRNQLLAEAHFMRAFAYYNLTDIFCRVPLVLDSEIPPTSKEKVATLEKVELQIEDDLLAAKEDLPKSYKAPEDAGRPTYGAACGYLCRLYMRQAGRERVAGGTGAWRDALVEVNNVLDLENQGYYSLQPTVWDVFDPVNGLYNNELIFAVRAADKLLANGSWDLGLQFTPWGYDMGWSNILQQLEMTWWFEEGDDRLNVLQVMEFPDVYNGTKVEKVYYRAPASIEKTGTIPNEHVVEGVNYATMTELAETYTQKYKYLYTREYNYNTPNNMPLLRLADMILCKAEILNELNGPNAESIGLINRIRERAFGNKAHNFNLDEFASKDELRDAICDERMYELNMECLRRPDLIRMGLWKNRMQRLMLTIDKKYEWKEKNEDKPGGYYDGSWAGYPKPENLTDDDLRQFIPIPYREVLMNSSLTDAREIDAVPTPDVTAYVEPHHWGNKGVAPPDDGGQNPPDDGGEYIDTGADDPDPPLKGSTFWPFDSQGSWTYTPQEGTPQSQTRFDGGYLYITSRAGTKDRPKYTAPGGATYGAGSYRFRVLIPTIEAGAQASIGAFIYKDDDHELDFEIGYGPAERRTAAGAQSDEMIAAMTNQNHPSYSGNAAIKPGWHTLRLDMEISGDYYNAVWYIDAVQVQTKRLNFGPEVKFKIIVSVENLSFMGDHLPTYDVTAKFDYVSFKAI